MEESNFDILQNIFNEKFVTQKGRAESLGALGLEYKLKSGRSKKTKA
jgi:hypothetical protein